MQIERPEFLLLEGSLQAKFLDSVAKIQMYGGGFGNGKTTAAVIKALRLATDYPGSTGLIARSTYPKLNDTIRKEFLKWCPAEWIKSFSTGQNGDNICKLKNGTTIYFRYIAQQGTGKGESSSSNLLSATFDWVIVDQIEDPEITYKDYMDLFGRMRGRTRYVGDDPRMPLTGPRWMMITCNPSGNWVYTKLVRPLHQYLATGVITDDLICVRDIDRKPVLKNGKPQLLLELIEGSTYELRHVHEEDGGDFIQTLETMYQGQQRDRFLLGKWAAYEGLVYPQYNITTHVLNHDDIKLYLEQLRADGYEPRWVEGYDFGQGVPSCYSLAMVNPDGIVIIVDGFYRAEMSIDDQDAEIKRIRREWGGEYDKILADPNIFTRKAISRKTVGKSIAAMFHDGNIEMRRGNNDIANGIVKVGSYLNISPAKKHPITGVVPSPRLFMSSRLVWLQDEFASYFWAKNTRGENTDKPVDRNDHGMDMVKYLLSEEPDVGTQRTKPEDRIPSYMYWQEHEGSSGKSRSARYG
jgi:hypothetical protein